VSVHSRQNPKQCTLFVNSLDIKLSFDRIFWCEKCQRFVWRDTEVYDALVDQLTYTMGTYLEEPSRDIHAYGLITQLDGPQLPFHAVAATTQGWRTAQEDSDLAFFTYLPGAALGEELSEAIAFFCVFDGHGGDAVAKIAALSFEDHVRAAIAASVADGTSKLLNFETTDDSSDPLHQQLPSRHEKLIALFKQVVTRALLSLDSGIRESTEGKRGDYNCIGCTACVVGLTKELVMCANAGDSGAALYTVETITPLSEAHRIEQSSETERIRGAGYSISADHRIEGLLAVPRALGDYDFKQCGGKGATEQAVIVLPDVLAMPLPTQQSRWGIILGCDGVWDTASMEQIHQAIFDTSLTSALVHDLPQSDGIIAPSAQLLRSAANIFTQCVAPTNNEYGVGLDNVSVIIIEPAR
jgi:serine/threonine protein phosphatase PrpC